VGFLVLCALLFSFLLFCDFFLHVRGFFSGYRGVGGVLFDGFWSFWGWVFWGCLVCVLPLPCL